MTPNPTRIRVIHLVNAYQHGGAEMVIRDLIAQSDPERFEFRVCALFDRHAARDWIDRLGVDFVSPQFRTVIDPTRLSRLFTIIHQFRPHLVHTHLPVSDLYGWGLHRLDGRAPLVTTLHNMADFYYANGPWLRRCEARAHRLAMNRWPGTIVAIAATVKHSFAGYLADWQRIQVVENGLDEQRLDSQRRHSRRHLRRRLGIPDTTSLLLSVGRLEEQKNYDLLIQAAGLLAASPTPFSLLIAGGGSQRRRLEQLIADAGLAQVIRLLGPTDDVVDLINAADCFVMTSVVEGLPMALLEAMMMGLPVVSTAVGAIPELITDKVTGRLVPAHDPHALAEAIQQVIASPDQAAEWAEHAQERVRSHYSAATMAGKYQLIYQELAESSSEPYD